MATVKVPKWQAQVFDARAQAASNVRVTINDSALDAALRGHAATVALSHARDVSDTATNLAAQRLGRWDPIRNPGGGDVLGRYRNGWLARKKPGTWKGSERAEAFNKAPYALILEEGSRPHEIKPKKPGGVLRFGIGRSDVKSRSNIRYAKSVMHPGTKPYRIGADAVERTPLR